MKMDSDPVVNYFLVKKSIKSIVILLLHYHIQGQSWKNFCISKMSHVILIDTIDHIRDLETYLKHCKDAINDIDEDLELFNSMKDSEIMILAQQKSSYNRQADQRKLKINKEIGLINDKIRSLKETVQKHNDTTDVEKMFVPGEAKQIERTQGLNVEV